MSCFNNILVRLFNALVHVFFLLQFEYFAVITLNILFIIVYSDIIESVDSISSDERDVALNAIHYKHWNDSC